jgi:hypothetical protein
MAAVARLAIGEAPCDAGAEATPLPARDNALDPAGPDFRRSGFVFPQFFREFLDIV